MTAARISFFRKEVTDRGTGALNGSRLMSASPEAALRLDFFKEEKSDHGDRA
jgi:hypothetical protein